jgi:hypothetical protein
VLILKGLFARKLCKGGFFPSAENKRLRPNYRFLEKKNARKMPELRAQGRMISRGCYARRRNLSALRGRKKWNQFVDGPRRELRRQTDRRKWRSVDPPQTVLPCLLQAQGKVGQLEGVAAAGGDEVPAGGADVF